MKPRVHLFALLALLVLLAAPELRARDGWTSASHLPGLQPLPAERHASLRKALTGTPIVYMFDEGPEHWQLYEGDLEIAGSLDLDAMLVVTGRLRIAGSLDGGHGSGHLIVLGDLDAEHVVSWGALQVGGDLNARGLVYAYYNDFSFGVQGKVNAAGLVVYDKFHGYTAGALGFDLGDGSASDVADIEAGKALRMLDPALLTDPEVLEPETGVRVTFCSRNRGQSALSTCRLLAMSPAE